MDLAHSIGEKTVLADHIEELIIAGKDEKENKEVLEHLLILRRNQMSYLLEQGVKPNPEYWCPFKHAIKSFTQDVEVFEATLSDVALAQMKASADILAMTMSKFLGIEFETCARCLNDRLLEIEYDKNNNKEK